MTESRIELFLNAVRHSFPEQDPKVYWPLNGGQVDAYFDVAEAFDVYERINELKKECTIKELAEIVPNSDILRSFLLNNGILGLKIARMEKLEPINNGEILDYLETIFDLIGKQVKNDIFCMDGKNLILTDDEVASLNFNWNVVDEATKRNVSNLVVTGTHYCYSLFYDLFKSTGFRIHGPYSMKNVFGDGSVLLVREYYNLNPTIWDMDFPNEKFTMYTVYKDMDFRLDLLNHPHSETGIGNKLIAYYVTVDGKPIGLDEMENFEQILEKKTLEQTAVVESLSDFDKIRKGAEISTYAFRKLRAHTKKKFDVMEKLEENIVEFDRKFLEEFEYKKNIPDINHWVALFDPRTDVL
jgi:hypothetical protein